MYPYLFTKNGERLPHSSMHARNLAMKPKGFACVLCYYSGSPLPKRTLIPLRKNEERLPIVACIIVAEISATIIRKFRDQGSKFSQETEGLLASYATIQEVFRSLPIVF